MKGFRDFLRNLNERIQSQGGRRPISSEVIHIAEGTQYLDPVTEVAEVQKMVNEHNLRYHDPSKNLTSSPYERLKIKRSVFYTGYLINEADSHRLVSTLLHPNLFSGLVEGNEVKPLANIIMITPRPASKAILQKAGEMGKKLSWRVTSLGHWDNKVWAARVEPAVSGETYYTEMTAPIVVLGLRRGARPLDADRIQRWQAVDPSNSLVFESVVGERVILRVDEESSHDPDWAGHHGKKGNHKRRNPGGRRDDEPPLSFANSRDSNPYQALNDQDMNGRSRHSGRLQSSSNYRGRGRGGRGFGSARGRGGFSRGSGRGRGRGSDGASRGYHGYRSLDEQQAGPEDSYDSHNGQGSSQGGVPLMNY